MVKGDASRLLSTTIAQVCLRCGSEKIRKNGHADNGAQRAKCLARGRTFVLPPKGARYDHRFKEQVVAASQDRMSLSRDHAHLRNLPQDDLALGGGKKRGSSRLPGHAAAR